MNVRVERIIDDNETTVSVELVVADKVVDKGYFGGEPEDNCECRDYSWVIPMLERAIKEERDYCAKVCEDEARRYREDLGCFTDESIIAADSAAYCGELIRGEQ